MLVTGLFDDDELAGGLIAEFEDEIGGKQQQLDFSVPEPTLRREEAKGGPSTEEKGLDGDPSTSAAQKQSDAEAKAAVSREPRTHNSRRDSVPWRDAFFAEGAGETESGRLT